MDKCDCFGAPMNEAIAIVKKMRREKIVGISGTEAQRRAWDKCRYDTLRAVEKALEAAAAEQQRIRCPD